MFGYVFLLIFTFPIAFLVHGIASAKLRLDDNVLFKAVIYGVLCSPCFIELGESLRNKTITLALYALFQGYDHFQIPIISQMGIFIMGLFLYFKVKSN